MKVLLVGSGARAEAWNDVIVRSTAFVAAGRVLGVGLPSTEADCFPTLAAALESEPTAAVAIAAPPHTALEAMKAAVGAGRSVLVGAPLPIDTRSWSTNEAAIQVAHGWVTLPGAEWLRRAAGQPGTRVSIDVRGLPWAAGGDLVEVLVHGLALARRFDPKLEFDGIDWPAEGRLELRTRAGLSLRLHCHGSGLEVRVESRGEQRGWVWNAGEERIWRAAGPRREERNRTVPSHAERALRQLLQPARAGGDDLDTARAVHEAAATVLEALPHRVPIGRRVLGAAARMQEAKPSAMPRFLGLDGAKVDFTTSQPAPLFELPTPSLSNEVWSFRAGLKPVAFLTMRPSEEEGIRALFPDTHIERLERRVHIGAQDAWVDDRVSGEPRIELYISRDPALARQALTYQSDDDPSARLRDLGALMGYPPCCVDAFEHTLDRSNNTRNRYATVARTAMGEVWPWELNNCFAMLVPFFPCSYTCESALAWARGTLAEMGKSHPEVVETLERWLSKPVLYFDHAHAVVLSRPVDGDTVGCAEAAVFTEAAPAMRALAGWMREGAQLHFGADAMVRDPGTSHAVSLRRLDPRLGVLMPFGTR